MQSARDRSIATHDRDRRVYEADASLDQRFTCARGLSATDPRVTHRDPAVIADTDISEQLSLELCSPEKSEIDHLELPLVAGCDGVRMPWSSL
jgi:hypothetical protein